MWETYFTALKEIFQVMINSNLSGKLVNYSDRPEKSQDSKMKRQKEAVCMNDENIYRRKYGNI